MSKAWLFVILFLLMKNQNHFEFTLAEYQEIIDFPIFLIAIINADGTFYKVNKVANPILGWEPEEVLGKPMHEFVHPDDFDETLALMTGLFLGSRGMVLDFRNRCFRKDGTYRWISWSVKAKGGKLYAMGADVTDEIEFQQELINQSIILENISEGVVIYDKNEVIVYANRAEENMFGYDHGELLGKSIKIISHPQSRDANLSLEETRKNISKTGVWEGEWQNLHKDGWTIYTSFRLSLLSLAGVDHFVCVHRNISERIAVEENFKRLSERLSHSVKVGKIGIWEWVPGSDTIVWDETTEEIYGFKKGTFPGTREAYNACLHPLEREKLWVTVENLLKKKESYVIDHRIITPDGRVRWVQGSGMALYDEHDKPYLMMGTCHDITERKQDVEDQIFLGKISDVLAASLDYKDTLSNMALASVDHFCDGCFIDQLNVDGKIERLVAIHPDAECKEILLNTKYKDESRYDGRHPLVTTLISGKTVLYRDMREYLPDQKDLLDKLNFKSVVISRLKGRESLLGTVTFFNLKDSGKNFDQRIIRLADELAYRASMALENSLLYHASQDAVRTRDQFLSIASHELKTPLTSLSLQNQIKRKQLQKKDANGFEKEAIGKMLDTDYRQLVRINRLIDDMLDISRIRGGKLYIQKEDIAFQRFLADVIDRFRPQMESLGCELTLGRCDEVQIKADSYRIEQVLVNMLTNAMKYGAGRPVKIQTQLSPGKLRVLVHDKGPGIAEEDVERIFHRFERAVRSSEVSGLGLGLYISREIMEQHNGSLTVISKLGEGSTFIMEIPL